MAKIELDVDALMEMLESKIVTLVADYAGARDDELREALDAELVPLRERIQALEKSTA